MQTTPSRRVGPSLLRLLPTFALILLAALLWQTPARALEVDIGRAPAEEKNAENLLIIRSQELARPYLENWRRHHAHSQS